MKRRKVISTVGGIAGLALAGCAEMGPGNDNEGNQPADNETETETTTTTESETDTGNETQNETDTGDISGEVGENIPDNIEVIRHNIFENNNWVGVTGLVENTGEQAFEELEVEVTLRDGDTIIGEFVDTKEQEAGSLAAGTNWQFVVLFEDENLNQATDYTIEIDGELADGAPGVGNETENGTGNESDFDIPTGEVGSIADNLQVVQQNIFQSGNQVGVAGAIKNTGDRAFEEVEVEVTLRDGDTVIGEFIDTNEEETDSLAAGAVWQFVVLFTDENLNQATDYTIEIDGELA